MAVLVHRARYISSSNVSRFLLLLLMVVFLCNRQFRIHSFLLLRSHTWVGVPLPVVPSLSRLRTSVRHHNPGFRLRLRITLFLRHKCQGRMLSRRCNRGHRVAFHILRIQCSLFSLSLLSSACLLILRHRRINNNTIPSRCLAKANLRDTSRSLASLVGPDIILLLLRCLHLPHQRLFQHARFRFRLRCPTTLLHRQLRTLVIRHINRRLVLRPHNVLHPHISLLNLQRLLLHLNPRLCLLLHPHRQSQHRRYRPLRLALVQHP